MCRPKLALLPISFQVTAAPSIRTSFKITSASLESMFLSFEILLFVSVRTEFDPAAADAGVPVLVPTGFLRAPVIIPDLVVVRACVVTGRVTGEETLDEEACPVEPLPECKRLEGLAAGLGADTGAGVGSSFRERVVLRGNITGDDWYEDGRCATLLRSDDGGDLSELILPPAACITLENTDTIEVPGEAVTPEMFDDGR